MPEKRKDQGTGTIGGDPRQVAVDRRGYYNESDIREARKDPKVDRNIRSVERARRKKRSTSKR